MSKKMSDKDRLLAFAFRATADELEDAIGVFRAALSAKRGGAKKPTTKKPTAQPKAADSPDTQ